jgi:hypothetical protein
MTSLAYSVIQFVPDAVRDERVNIGIVVTARDHGYFGARIVSRKERGRLRRFGVASEFAFLDDLARELQASERSDDQLPVGDGWNLDLIEHASREWANTVRFTAPRGALHDRPDQLLKELFDRYVADPAPPRARARDRRSVNRRVTTGLKRALDQARAGIEFDDHVKRNVIVGGRFDQHRFDFELRNTHPLQLLRSLSFESTDERGLQTEIDAIAWAIDDLRGHNGNPPVSVITIGDHPLRASAERVYGGLGAELILEDRLPAWLDDAATRLVLALTPAGAGSNVNGS